MSGLRVQRAPQVLHPDPNRVVGRPYTPGDDPAAEKQTRLARIAGYIVSLSDAEVRAQLEDVRCRFSARHHDLGRMLWQNGAIVAGLLGGAMRERQLLAGAYLTHEFAFEAAALSNPSMVPATDQSRLPEGAKRFVMSLRAVGEGHLSSIEFRTGLVHANGSVQVDVPGPHTETGDRRDPEYDRTLFGGKLEELGADTELTWRVLDQLPDHFERPELDEAVKVLDNEQRARCHETIKLIMWLAASNYLVDFDAHTLLEDRLLWPEGPFESRGMEDARFVHFTKEDGRTTYYATYTAFDGFEILPQLIETSDFQSFEISTLNGRSAQNKGMALFPRLIDGRYVALSRPDRESIHLLSSHNPRFWASPSVPLRRPREPWEIIQMGNCGSPLETSEGWLVITHGVGAMRTYRLGAVLLDLEDPERVIGDLPYPILEADGEERDGYVPNVVYSCGGMIHEDQLFLPYGIADRSTGFAVLSIPELLEELLAHPA